MATTQSQQKQTHYQVLGIPRSATPSEVTRAYKKLVKANERDDVAPDRHRDQRILTAYETLSDEALRDAYDQTLLVKKAKGGGKLVGISIACAAAVIGGAIWHLNRPVQASAKPARTAEQIQLETLRAVGRVHSIGISGSSTAVGLAFAVEPGVMGVPCEGLTPGAQLTVEFGDRRASAREVERDPASGFCKIAVDGGASWPLPLGGGPNANEKVYVVAPTPEGKVALLEATVKAIGTDGKQTVYTTSATLPETALGGPLVDVTGRVLGVAGLSGGQVRHVPIPPVWLAEKVEIPREKARNVEPWEDPKAAGSAPAEPIDPRSVPRGQVLHISPQQQEELRKRYRPDPTVPKDL